MNTSIPLSGEAISFRNGWRIFTQRSSIGGYWRAIIVNAERYGRGVGSTQREAIAAALAQLGVVA